MQHLPLGDRDDELSAADNSTIDISLRPQYVQGRIVRSPHVIFYCQALESFRALSQRALWRGKSEMQMWTAIKYVTSGITLIAFICAVAAWLYNLYLHERERLIKSVPESQRAKLVQIVEQTRTLFRIDIAKLSRKHQYELALRQLSEQTKKFQMTAVVILVIAGLITLLVFGAIPRTAPLPTVPTPTPTSPSTPTPSPVRLLGEIEDVQIVPGKGDVSQVFIQLSIKNTGGATSASQYAIQIHSQTQKLDFKGFPDKLTERYTLPRNGKEREQEIVIQPQDSIISKTEQEFAHRVRGWLRLTLPLPADVLRQSGMQYTVSFADADRVSYTTPSYKMQ